MNKNMSGVRAITLDVAVTLLKPHPCVGVIYAEVLNDHGGHANPQVLEKRFHTALRETNTTANSMGRSFWKAIVLKTLGNTCPRENFEACFNELWETFAEGRRWVTLKDTEDTLRQLKDKGYQLAILSNIDSRLHSILDDKGLNGFFEEIFISEEIGHSKPSIKIFRRAEQALNCKPKKILHIGDSFREDYLGAKNAGWQAILIKPERPTAVPETDWIANWEAALPQGL